MMGKKECLPGGGVIAVVSPASQRNPLGSKFVQHVDVQNVAEHSSGKFFGPLNFIFFPQLFIKTYSFQ